MVGAHLNAKGHFILFTKVQRATPCHSFGKGKGCAAAQKAKGLAYGMGHFHLCQNFPRLERHKFHTEDFMQNLGAGLCSVHQNTSRLNRSWRVEQVILNSGTAL